MLSDLYAFFLPQLKLLTVIVCILTTLVSYLLFYNNSNHLLLFLLIYADVICLAIIIFILGYRVAKISKRLNKRFSRQIFGLFCTVAIVPPILVFAFALVFFDMSIRNFFNTPINNAIVHSNEISKVYINDLQSNLNGYIEILALNVSQKDLKKDDIIQILKDEQISRKLNFILFYPTSNGLNVIYQTPFSSELQRMLILNNIVLANEATYEIEGYVVAIRCLNSSENLFLAVTAQIDNDILSHRNNIKTANEQYMTLISERLNIKVSFIMLFSGIVVIMILLAVFMGVIYSRKVLSPINKLITAINRISQGNYETYIILKKQNNEWDELIVIFNNMVKSINEHKERLAMLNKQMAWKDIARKIAHEIKNPLTPILLSAERLRNKYRKEIITSPETFDTCLNTIVRQVSNMNELVREFSEFARLPEPTLEPNDLIKLIREVVCMNENAYRDIKFQYNLPYDKLIFKFDVVQINQVLINIIVNAVHAITENVLDNARKNILISCILKNNSVFTTIEDDGVGFSDAVLKKALEPYYTTRKNGTGLGLAIVYKIMNDHNGKIILGNSQVLHGAKITLILPYEI